MEDGDTEVAGPDEASNGEFKDGYKVTVAEIEDGSKEECGREAEKSGEKEATSHGVEFFDGGKVWVDALVFLFFEAVPLDKKH